MKALRNDRGRYKFHITPAFTLAEVLITLGIIGVVATITLPSLITNTTERINSERQANVAQKITQAMERMKAGGLLNQTYDSTESFVKDLQKYLKITKHCDKDHLADCWPTQKVTAGDGVEYDVTNFKTGKDLGLLTSTTNNVGLILADGGAIILNYDNTAQGIDVGDRVTAFTKSLPVGNGKSKNFTYSSSVTAPIDFVIDTNGAKGSNTENIDNKWGDIRSFKIANFSACPGFRITGVGCVTDLSTSYLPAQTPDLTLGMSCSFNEDGNFNCSSPTINNYYQGAVATCESYGMHLTTGFEITAIQSQYGKIAGVPESGQYWVESTMSSWRSTVNGNYVYGHSIHTFAPPIDPNEQTIIAPPKGGGPTNKAQDTTRMGVLCVKNE